MPIESALILLLTGVVLFVIYAVHNVLMLAACVFLHVGTEADDESQRINGGLK